jgi:hypothetical protein
VTVTQLSEEFRSLARRRRGRLCAPTISHRAHAFLHVTKVDALLTATEREVGDAP